MHNHSWVHSCYWRPECLVADSHDGEFSIPPEWVPYQQKYPCLWMPHEEAEIFVAEAKRVQAVLKALVWLRDQKTPVPADLWQHIGVSLDEVNSSTRLDWETLFFFVSGHLEYP